MNNDLEQVKINLVMDVLSTIKESDSFQNLDIEIIQLIKMAGKDLKKQTDSPNYALIERACRELLDDS